jgi:hypothetical protein
MGPGVVGVADHLIAYCKAQGPRDVAWALAVALAVHLSDTCDRRGICRLAWRAHAFVVGWRLQQEAG